MKNDKAFLTGERTIEGFYRTNPGIDQAISRGLAYAPYADLCGVKPANLTSSTHAALQRQSTPSFQQDAVV